MGPVRRVPPVMLLALHTFSFISPVSFLFHRTAAIMLSCCSLGCVLCAALRHWKATSSFVPRLDMLGTSVCIWSAGSEL
jgi:hypothetical protein